jgi:hypothetical protein
MPQKSNAPALRAEACDLLLGGSPLAPSPLALQAQRLIAECSVRPALAETIAALAFGALCRG